MSNLWFFRLRGEPSAKPSQRRRSSSERFPLDQLINSSSTTTTSTKQSSTFQSQSMTSPGPSSRLFTPRGSSGSNFFDRDSTVFPHGSGHVPPLHRKTLQPGTSINLADSLDNVAQLIPRFVCLTVQLRGGHHYDKFTHFLSGFLFVICSIKLYFNLNKFHFNQWIELIAHWTNINNHLMFFVPYLFSFNN